MIRDPRVNARTHAFMTLASLLTPDRVIPSMQATEHWPAIEELIDQLIAVEAFPAGGRDGILESLRDREDQRTTGIGGGIAIPHAFSDQIDDVIAIIGRSPGGIDFGAPDDIPVNFVVLFVVPSEQYTLHLRTLAAIAKILNSGEVRAQLAAAADRDAMIEVLSMRAMRA